MLLKESYEERTSAVGEPVKFARRLSHIDGHVLGCPVYPEGMQRICDRSRHSQVILKGNADANRKTVSTGTSRSACTPSIWRVWTESRRTISKHIPPPTPSLPLLTVFTRAAHTWCLASFRNHSLAASASQPSMQSASQSINQPNISVS